MNKVQEFLNEKFGEVRTVLINNQIWFVARDVSNILQYDKATDMTRNLEDDESDTQTLLIRSDTGVEQNRECLIINESGLYDAVLSITKRNKERYLLSREFKRWITGTVIPAIRKDGAYINGEEDFAKDNISEDEFVFKAMEILQNKIKRLKAENEQMKPKVDKWSKFLNSNGTYSFTEVSKLMSTMGQEEHSDVSISVVKLTDFLRNEGVLSKAKAPDKPNKKGSYKNLPNKDFEQYFNVVDVETKGNFNKIQTRVKATGVEYIYDLVKNKYNKVN